MAHQLPCADLVILHISLDRIDHFAQIVGGDAGRHTNGDPFRAVDQEIGKTHRQNLRLLLCLIEVRDKIHDILVKIRQICLLSHLRKARLRVTHGCRAVPFNRTEVAVSVNQDHPLLKFLRHDHQRLIDRAVPVRVILTHGIAHDTGALTIRPVITYSQLMHVVQGTPLYRLKTVPNVRQRTSYDHTHGVVDV